MYIQFTNHFPTAPVFLSLKFYPFLISVLLFSTSHFEPGHHHQLLFHNTTQLPLISWEKILLYKNNIINYKIALNYMPLLSNGNILEVFPFPSTPKLFDQKLYTAPTL
ncbi:hypothetical protein XENOCAPTIV_012297 [Xenoophorus captivus]|uniref:Uncharacterized protein n=1 Tax=Xenoophorus captivus TaxID=1517983 RepID=A0ABV0RS81_9TELE